MGGCYDRESGAWRARHAHRNVHAMLPVILEPAQAGRIAPTRVVMLPAAFTTPADFVRQGFARAVRERSLEVDLVFAAIKLEQVIDRSVFAQLTTEIILPARAPHQLCAGASGASWPRRSSPTAC